MDISSWHFGGQPPSPGFPGGSHTEPHSRAQAHTAGQHTAVCWCQDWHGTGLRGTCCSGPRGTRCTCSRSRPATCALHGHSRPSGTMTPHPLGGSWPAAAAAWASVCGKGLRCWGHRSNHTSMAPRAGAALLLSGHSIEAQQTLETAKPGFWRCTPLLSWTGPPQNAQRSPPNPREEQSPNEAPPPPPRAGRKMHEDPNLTLHHNSIITREKCGSAPLAPWIFGAIEEGVGGGGGRGAVHRGGGVTSAAAHEISLPWHPLPCLRFACPVALSPLSPTCA